MRINNLKIWSILMAGLFSNNCTTDPGYRLLAIGGIHIFDNRDLCKLTQADPIETVNDLKWTNVLAIEGLKEGTAEVICGKDHILLKVIAPSRLEIELVSEGEPEDMMVQELFQVRIHLYDSLERELEVGKFTIFDWAPSGVLEVANDRSSGEFGFNSTSFGMHSFRAIKPGEGRIQARLGSLKGELTIIAHP